MTFRRNHCFILLWFLCVSACNVLYLYTLDTESLTGPQAIKKAVHHMFSTRPLPTATVVHFKVSGQGITLTDNKRQLFFRRHYPVATISYCGLDPDDHRWSQKSDETGMPISSKWVVDLEQEVVANSTLVMLQRISFITYKYIMQCTALLLETKNEIALYENQGDSWTVEVTWFPPQEDH